MNNLEGIDIEEFHRELRVEDQDLRLLKALVSSEDDAREFIATYDHNLFVGDSKGFARKAIQYVQMYGSLPTRRVMLDQAGHNNTDYEDEVNFIWDKLDDMEHVPSEFKYDLDKIKNRHSRRKFASLKHAIGELDYGNIDYDEVIVSFRSTLDEAAQVRKGTEDVYVQKTLKEYMPEFRDDFVAKASDEEIGRGIMSGFSFLDYVTNGLSEADLWIVGGETGAGKSMFLANMAVQIWMQKNTIDTPQDKFTKGYNVQYFLFKCI